MSVIQSESELAHFVVQRARLSIRLVEGLRGALLDVGRGDMVPVLDLIHQNANEARMACLEIIANRRMARRMAVEMDLERIEALGGPVAKHAAVRLFANLHSGPNPIFPAGNPNP